MSDSYERKPSRDERRHDPAGKGGRNTAGSSFLFSALLGFTIAFFLAAGTVVLLRVIESETDGMNAFIQALMVLGPALLLLVAAIVVRKKSKSKRRFSKQVAGVCAVVGLAAGAALWVTSPTQRELADKLLEDNAVLFKQRAEQLAACRAQLDDYPPGTLGGKISAEQLVGLKSVKMNLNRSDYELSDGWNTLLATDTDFARLKPGSDPDDIMDRFDRPKPSFRSPDTYAYAPEFNGKIDELADSAYGDPYLWRREAEELVATFKPLRYLVIVRAADINQPLLTGEEFIPGYFSGEAFCFDLEEKRLIAGFLFAATNSERVSYTYEKNSNVTSVANSAMHSLQEDLTLAAWPAFWRKFHQLAQTAVSPNKELELPFKPLALREAKVAWMRKRIEEAVREQQVQEELESLESGAGSADATAGTPVPLNAEQEAEVRKLITDEGLIPAVKRIREITGLGLAESKAIVDALNNAGSNQGEGREASPRPPAVKPPPRK